MDYFKLGAVLTLKDMLSEKMEGIKGKFDDLRKKLKNSADDLAMFESAMKNLKIGAAVAGSGLLIAGGLIAARVESSKLEANIRSLGVTSAETDKIAQSTRIMAAEYGIAKETFLGGIYDIKSAVSSLDPGQLAGITEQVARLAIATKGDFGGLSDLFGTTHAQFKRMYEDLNDETFAELFGNTIAYAANVYKTDGAKMQIAMQSLGASASALKVPLEEQSAILGRLQNTMQAGVAGTSYRDFLNKAPAAFKALGMSAIDAQGKVKSVPDLLDAVQKKFGDLNAAKLEKLDKAGFDIEGLNFMKELLPYSKELRAEIKTIKDMNAKGDFSFVDMSAKENMKSLAAQLDRVSAGWKSFKDLVGKGFGDSFIAPLAAKIADVFQWIQTVAAQNPVLEKFLSNLGGLIVGVTVLGGLFLAVSAGMKLYNLLMYQNALATGLAKTASGAYQIGLSLLGNGFSLAAVKAGLLRVAQAGLNAVMAINPIFAVITGILLLIVYWDQLKQSMIKTYDFIKEKWNSMPEWAKVVMQVWQPLIFVARMIIKHWDDLTSFFRQIWERLKPIFERIGGFFEWLAESKPSNAGEKLAIDMRKSVKALDELREKQQLLKNAGQTNLPEYQELTKQIKLQSDALAVLKRQETERAGVSTNIDTVKQRIAALQSAVPAASQAGKIGIEAQITALTALQTKLQGALDTGDMNLAKKLGDKSLMNEIENKGIKLAETFAQGMKKGTAYTDAQVKDMVGSIVRFLPASDAKQGPLSRLTASGRALVRTFNKGVEVEGRNTEATERFVSRQSRAIKTDSPLMQKISEGAAGARMAANAMIGNVYLTLSGKNLNREEFARQLADELIDILDKAEPA